LVDAFSVYLGSRRNCCMNIRGNTQHQFPGVGPLWDLAGFLADGEIVVDRFVSGILQIIDGRAMKTHDILDSRQMADKEPIVLVVLDVGGIALVFYQGFLCACYSLIV
jgi:hypothetical protein